ncbi:MAG: hypothetical protein K8E66_05185, partial [Phycisphaerales bacterium]|nr:hypothetical protein [Phycisphaerales bacterium]
GNREAAVAFQAMIWEIVYDFDGSEESLDLNSGSVRISMIRAPLFETMKGSAMRGGPGSSLEILTSEHFNDTLRLIPLPSGGAMAGLGLAGLIALRRRRAHHRHARPSGQTP